MKKYWLAILLGATVLAAGCKSNTAAPIVKTVGAVFAE